ncbi:MAG: hypothetical protein FWB88_08915 [Defluviitaleaceae bacterium]|nr:hypothetical protein [Defluviitaleaceae bacterium]MCL2239528.1 hypothetical protein [Defluviitaleaceae bacterium]
MWTIIAIVGGLVLLGMVTGGELSVPAAVGIVALFIGYRFFKLVTGGKKSLDTKEEATPTISNATEIVPWGENPEADKAWVIHVKTIPSQQLGKMSGMEVEQLRSNFIRNYGKSLSKRDQMLTDMVGKWARQQSGHDFYIIFKSDNKFETDELPNAVISHGLWSLDEDCKRLILDSNVGIAVFEMAEVNRTNMTIILNNGYRARYTKVI